MKSWWVREFLISSFSVPFWLFRRNCFIHFFSLVFKFLCVSAKNCFGFSFLCFVEFFFSFDDKKCVCWSFCALSLYRSRKKNLLNKILVFNRFSFAEEIFFFTKKRMNLKTTIHMNIWMYYTVSVHFQCYLTSLAIHNVIKTKIYTKNLRTFNLSGYLNELHESKEISYKTPFCF